MPKFSAYMKGGNGPAGPPGASFISGIVATTNQLPENPPENRQIYLVGESNPKHIYAYVDGAWTDQGLTASEVANANATIQSIGWTEDPTVQVSFSTENQKDYFNFDFAVPKTRPAGFGTSSDASVTTIAFGATPTVSVSASGEDWEKNFHFDFNIPAGEPAGFGTPHVEVEKVPSGTDPIVEISTVTTSPENAKEFNFHFGIPEGIAAGFSTNQNVSVSTLDADEQAIVEISTVTTSPETEKVFNFHFGIPEAYPGRVVIDSLTTNVKSISTRLDSISTNLNSNYVKIAGDTMTGDLSVKSLIADNSVTPSETIYRGINFKDKNGNNSGKVRGFWSKWGNVGCSLVAYRSVNGTDVVNEFAVGVTPTGGFVTSITPAAVPEWRKAFKTILYYNNRTLSAVTNSIFLRIPAGSTTTSDITEDTVVLECDFDKPSAITSDITWQSYDGYITFTGTCADASCKANVVLGNKAN